MSKHDRTMFKIMNKLVTQKDFENKNPDDYIYASLSQPPIKVLDKHGTDDEFKWTVECPNCKRAVIYGDEIFMVSGHLYCSDEKCKKQAYERAGVENA